ncbi:MAG: hypothetical protein MSR29_08110 [Lachnospiraceae bacterium]|nr:hypothetical protein [Lachnospiraceae bacterium]
MDKKLSIEIVKLKAGIAQAINDTDVPACVVAMVLNEYLTNVNELAKQQYLADMSEMEEKENKKHDNSSI